MQDYLVRTVDLPMGLGTQKDQCIITAVPNSERLNFYNVLKSYFDGMLSVQIENLSSLNEFNSADSADSVSKCSYPDFMNQLETVFETRREITKLQQHCKLSFLTV